MSDTHLSYDGDQPIEDLLDRIHGILNHPGLSPQLLDMFTDHADYGDMFWNYVDAAVTMRRGLLYLDTILSAAIDSGEGSAA